MKELQGIFQVFKSKLKELNETAVRDRKYDSPMVNETWIDKTLKSNLSPREKKQLLLTQIGYLRINIFTEYFERVNLLREKNQLDPAVELMNEHAEIARILIPTKKQSALTKRLKNLLSIKNIEPIEYLKQWRKAYKEWHENTANQQIDEKNQLRKFDKLKMAFLELYTFSFSVDNFPPLRHRRSDH